MRSLFLSEGGAKWPLESDRPRVDTPGRRFALGGAACSDEAPMTQPLKVAVQMDPIETINIDGDSTFALMLEAQRRGHAMWHYEVRHMSLHEGRRSLEGRITERLMATARPVTVQRRAGAHYSFGPAER